MQVTRQTIFFMTIVLLVVMTMQLRSINSDLKETKIKLDHINSMLKDIVDE